MSIRAKIVSGVIIAIFGACGGASMQGAANTTGATNASNAAPQPQAAAQAPATSVASAQTTPPCEACAKHAAEHHENHASCHGSHPLGGPPGQEKKDCACHAQGANAQACGQGEHHCEHCDGDCKGHCEGKCEGHGHEDHHDDHGSDEQNKRTHDETLGKRVGHQKGPKSK